MIPVQVRQYLRFLELFLKILSAKWVQNNLVTEPMVPHSLSHEDSEGQAEGKPEAAWPGHWATWPRHGRSAAQGPEAQAWSRYCKLSPPRVIWGILTLQCTLLSETILVQWYCWYLHWGDFCIAPQDLHELWYYVLFANIAKRGHSMKYCFT